jgi:hypothetical protein
MAAMTSLSDAAPRAAAPAFVLPLFAATLFLSAALLFAVQPMMAKLVLPLLGGAPAVWNTAMMFFQAALLAGYAYAHLLAQRLRPARQVVLHLALVIAGFLFLPLALPEGWAPPAEGSPVLWLVAVLAVSVGLPFVAVSATAPLLQAWFARSGHAAAADPYFLYAASNLGSILALLAYPLAIEPALPVSAQRLAWTGLYGLLVLLIALCGWRAGGRPLPAPAAEAEAAPPRVAEIGRWVLLAMAPSSLLLGVTTFITTDVASAPLFWVVPLTLYLLSFVIVFARRPWLRHDWLVLLQPFVFIPLGIFYTFGTTGRLALVIPLHLVAFFIAALVCHGELARARPAARHLTAFYLWMSVGGVLGGIFNAILAPLLFNGVWEYPLAIVLAAALRPRLSEGRRSLDLALPILLLAFLMAPSVIGEPLAHLALPGQIVFFALAGMAVYAFQGRPLRFALGVGAMLAVGFIGSGTQTLAQGRSFFGVYRVESDESRGLVTLVHGTTLHGGRLADPERMLMPITYYNPAGPIGDVFALARPPARIAVIGLGTGTMACWTRPGDTLAFYEIDPAVVALARDTRYFAFLAGCAPEAQIVLGDARLKLAEAADGDYDRILVDAFSSDAIPIHLLTREAIALYMRKLAPDGILVLHISNRHLSLVPVVAALARDAGLVAVRREDESTAEGAHTMQRTRSDFVALARRPETLAFLAHGGDWQALEAGEAGRVWSDDYSDIVGALRLWRRRSE